MFQGQRDGDGHRRRNHTSGEREWSGRLRGYAGAAPRADRAALTVHGAVGGFIAGIVMIVVALVVSLFLGEGLFTRCA